MSIQVEVGGFGICQTVAPYAVMVIYVQQPNFHAWTVYRLLESFEALSDQLQQVVPNTPPVPQFDHSNLSCEYLEMVRYTLDLWIKEITTNEFIFRTQSMYLFLCAEANQPPPFLSVHYQPSPEDAGEMDMDMEELFDRNGEEGMPEEEYGESDASPVSGGSDAWSFSQQPGSPSQHAMKQRKGGKMKRPSIRTSGAAEQAAAMVEDDGLDIQSISLVQGAEFLYDWEEEKEKDKKSSSKLSPTNASSAQSSVSTGMTGSNVTMESTPVPKRTISLESFHIIKVIGKGSFGKVFLVRDKARQTLHALKVLKKDYIIKKNQVEHTRTERSVLGHLRHPFIVGLTMAFQTADKLFFVLDYCAGGELFFQLGKTGRFPEDRSMHYAAQITLALEHVHKLGIIYRDLKPENVLLDHLGNIRLTDFGLSKEGVSHHSRGATSFCGTPEYIAPEVLLRQGHGRAVDWWSLGALLYEMITGLPPFYSRNRDTMFDKIMRAELSFPPFMSKVSKDLLSKLLVRDPTARLGSGERDAAELKEHPFFQSMDFVALFECRITTPWTPTVAGSLDTSQFDAEFTSMQPTVSPAEVRGAYFGSMDDRAFEGFTFVNESAAHLVHQVIAGQKPGGNNGSNSARGTMNNRSQKK